jgi:hypothetical protein
MKPKKTSLKNKTRTASKSKLTLHKITKPAESKSKSKKHGKKILKDIENKKTTQKIKPKTKAIGLKISSIKKGKTVVSGVETKKLPSKSKSPAKVAAKKSVFVRNKSAGKPKTKAISKIAAKPVLRVAPIKLSTKGAKTGRKTSKTTTAIRERVSRNKKPVKALIPSLPSVSTLDISKLENDIVGELILLAKEQGYITYENLDHNLPKGLENIYAHRDAIISKLRDAKIGIVDSLKVDHINEDRKDEQELLEIIEDEIDFVETQNNQQLKSFNKIILDKINASRLEGATILGLLPIEQHEQLQVISAVRDFASSRYYHLIELLLGSYQAAAVYAIAMARASVDEGVSSWQAIKQHLGVDVAVNKREELSQKFIGACRQLLLDDGQIGLLANEAPILYQSGILIHWVVPLCDGIRRTLDEMPAANPDDEEYLGRFCLRIASKIPQAQKRLRYCLGSPDGEPTRLGIFIIQKLLKSKLLGQAQLLPPHLSEPITEAMQKVDRKKEIYPPYLHFDAIDKMLRIILPKQNHELLTPQSNWEFNKRNYNPHRETEINLQDIRDEFFDIFLNQIAGQLNVDSFKIRTEIGGQTPFRIFNSKSGRDLKSRSGQNTTIQIPPGEYDLLADATLPQAGITVLETFQVGNAQVNWSRLVFRHNDPPLNFVIEGMQYCLEVKQTPGLFIYGDFSLEDVSEDKKKLYYGGALCMMAVTPRGILQNAQISISISTAGNDKSSRELINANLVGCGEKIPSDVLDRQLLLFINQLPAGIFKISVKLEIGAITLPCEFWYWKGLLYVNEAFGFGCNKSLSNIEINSLEGFQVDQGGIKWDALHSKVEASITVLNPRETFVFRKPGIHIQVQGDVIAEYMRCGETLLVSHHDNRNLLINTSGYETWTIKSGQTVLTTLNYNKKDCAIRISAAAGESRMITAVRGEDNAPITLATLIRPFEATGLKITRTASSPPTYTAEFTVSKGIFSVGIAQSDLMAQKFPVVEGVHEIVLPVAGAPSESYQFELGISIVASLQVDGSHHIKVEANLDSLTEHLTLLDIYYRRREGGTWGQLQYAEDVGTSPMRLVISPMRYTFVEPTAWKLLVAHADRKGLEQTQALTHQLAVPQNTEIQSFLTLLVELMLYKYPTPVWRDALERDGTSWPEQALKILGESRFSHNGASPDIWFQAAAHETTRRSSTLYAPLISGSLYSAQPKLYTLRTNFDASGQSFIERSFQYGGIASLSATLTDFFHQQHGINIGDDFVMSFRNIAALRDFDFNLFFMRVKEGVFQNVGCVLNPTQDRLLSSNHFIDCARKMNNRISNFEVAIKNLPTDHPLTRLLQSITGMHQQFENLQGALRDDLGYPLGFFSEPHEDHPPGIGYLFPAVEPHWGNKIIHIMIVLTGMSRLTCYGLRSENWFNHRLNTLLNPRSKNNGLDQGIRIIHSLAPEFFAFFHLFWSLTLKANSDNR